MTELKFTSSVQTVGQFKAAVKHSFSRIYVPIHVIQSDVNLFVKYREKVAVVIPAVLLDNEIARYIEMLANLHATGFYKLCVNNIGELGFSDWELYGGFRLNVFNSEAVQFWADMGLKSITVSTELNLAQIRDLGSGAGYVNKVPLEAIIYGRIPLMTLENYIGAGAITDRKKIKFPVIRDGESRRSVILNSRPLVMYDKLRDIKNLEFGSLYFTVESENEVNIICKNYFGGQMPNKEREFTRGNFYKGVK